MANMTFVAHCPVIKSSASSFCAVLLVHAVVPFICSRARISSTVILNNSNVLSKTFVTLANVLGVLFRVDRTIELTLAIIILGKVDLYGVTFCSS